VAAAAAHGCTVNPIIILISHHRVACGDRLLVADRCWGPSSPENCTNVIMRVLLAVISADRISHSAILVACTLCGILVFSVAAPLALSNPFRAPREGTWVIDRPSPRVAAPITLPPDQAAAIMDEVDDYLWEVYQRAPTKRDSAGDFTWKDPAAAKRFGISMPAYVISGMDPDFREQLYHAGRAMDATGIRWSILSAFRDDYRQSIASGRLKAGASNSLHGGKRRTGGYGHGQAVDMTSEDGNSSAVWHWIDAHGGKFGLYRPMPGADPAHVQPKGSWHKLAVTLREGRARLTQEAHIAQTANTTAR
jgi:hypothetical protein